MEEIGMFQEDNISNNDKYFENNSVYYRDISFEKDIDLEIFLSKKIEGLLELDNLTDNLEEKAYKSHELNGTSNHAKEKVNNINTKGAEEILNIYRRVWSDKKSPFKIFLKPKKLSLNGRILDNFSFN